MRRLRRLALLVAVLPVSAGTAPAADYFLTIGGGYQPSGNQVSLEKNTQLFQRMLGEFYPEGADHTIFFADGADPGRDLQYVDPSFDVPKANRYLAELFNKSDQIDYQYRNHEIDGVAGPSAKPELDKWFNEVGRQLHAGDRLFVYVTAHGGRSPDNKQPFDTVLHLWNHQQIRMHDLVHLLDEVRDEVPVVLMMVQCYSGGFANSIFQEGNTEKGMSAANRCGFFATVHDRVAAGCTPDINEANYHEFSTSFFEALRAKTRFDEPVERPDYDGDGRTSLAEAYAYVVLTSNTIDIPVRTSDAFLRAYSKLPEQTAERPGRRRRGGRPQQMAETAPAEQEPQSGEPKACQDAPPKAVPSEEPEAAPQLLRAETDCDELLAVADPIDRAIIEGLSKTLELIRPNRALAARNKSGEIEKERQQIDKQRGELFGEYNRIRNGMRQQVLEKWPEIGNPWHPLTTELLTTRASELVEIVEGHPQFARFQELEEKIEALDTQKMNFERTAVKCQRLLRALENVALAANLPQVATPEQIERYAQLRAAESTFFGPLTETPAGEAVPVSAAP